MKAEPLLQEIEATKERLNVQARGDTRQFLNQMVEWLAEHPHPGPVVNSPAEWKVRLQEKETDETPRTAEKPYRIYDPIIAEIHRFRAASSHERSARPAVLHEVPSQYRKPDEA